MKERKNRAKKIRGVKKVQCLLPSFLNYYPDFISETICINPLFPLFLKTSFQPNDLPCSSILSFWLVSCSSLHLLLLNCNVSVLFLELMMSLIYFCRQRLEMLPRLARRNEFLIFVLFFWIASILMTSYIFFLLWLRVNLAPLLMLKLTIFVDVTKSWNSCVIYKNLHLQRFSFSTLSSSYCITFYVCCCAILSVLFYSNYIFEVFQPHCILPITNLQGIFYCSILQHLIRFCETERLKNIQHYFFVLFPRC